MVMETKIENSRNGDQLLTVTDPNTGIKVTMPMYEKGKPPTHIRQQLKEQENGPFQNLMIWQKAGESSLWSSNRTLRPVR